MLVLGENSKIFNRKLRKSLFTIKFFTLFAEELRNIASYIRGNRSVQNQKCQITEK